MEKKLFRRVSGRQCRLSSPIVVRNRLHDATADTRAFRTTVPSCSVRKGCTLCWRWSRTLRMALTTHLVASISPAIPRSSTIASTNETSQKGCWTGDCMSTPRESPMPETSLELEEFTWKLTDRYLTRRTRMHHIGNFHSQTLTVDNGQGAISRRNRPGGGRLETAISRVQDCVGDDKVPASPFY